MSMNVYQWLCVAGIPSVITLMITRIITRRLNDAESRADETQKRSDAIAMGIQALLRDRLLQGYKHYQEKGWADYEDRANLENVWQQYHALGGNGDPFGHGEVFPFHIPVQLLLQGGLGLGMHRDGHQAAGALVQAADRPDRKSVV